MYICMIHIYIYIYIYREREREKGEIHGNIMLLFVVTLTE